MLSTHWGRWRAYLAPKAPLSLSWVGTWSHGHLALAQERLVNGVSGKGEGKNCEMNQELVVAAVLCPE